MCKGSAVAEGTNDLLRGKITYDNRFQDLLCTTLRNVLLRTVQALGDELDHIGTRRWRWVRVSGDSPERWDRISNRFLLAARDEFPVHG